MADKNSIFGGMITTLGAAKKTNCDALGVPWEPCYMLIGDANGADPLPSPTQTKLINQVYRAQLNQLRVSPTDANVLIAEVVLPPDVGGWHIRELALEDKDGVFSAVANVPPSYKPLLAQGSGRNQVVRMHIITSGTSNIQLKIDPSVVLATRQYVDEAVSGLLPANKPAGTYTKITVNDRGMFVSGSNPTTLAGYGITDAISSTPKSGVVGAIADVAKHAVAAYVSGTTDKPSSGGMFLRMKYPGDTPMAFDIFGHVGNGYDVFGFRRVIADGTYVWRTVWHDGNFDPSKKADKATTLAGYGITDAVPADRIVVSTLAPKAEEGVLGTIWLQVET